MSEYKFQDFTNNRLSGILRGRDHMCTLIIHNPKLRNGEIMFLYRNLFMQYIEHVRRVPFNMKKRRWQEEEKKIS